MQRGMAQFGSIFFGIAGEFRMSPFVRILLVVLLVFLVFVKILSRSSRDIKTGSRKKLSAGLADAHQRSHNNTGWKSRQCDRELFPEVECGMNERMSGTYVGMEANENLLAKSAVFFNKSKQERFIPRTVCCDLFLDDMIQVLQSSKVFPLYRFRNITPQHDQFLSMFRIIT